MSLLLSNCNNKEKPNSSIGNKDKAEKNFSECKKFNKKFNDKVVLEENDSALIYINKAIECNPKSTNYKFSKIQFLMDIKKYNDAIKPTDELILISDDPFFKVLKAILLLKTNDSNWAKLLDNTYREYNQIQNPTSNNQFYKIALDNYFKGKDFALIEVGKFKEQHKGKPYENQNINAIENLIKNESKENVLFKLFNIRE